MGITLSYKFSARSYLARAKDCLQKDEPRFFFYAALELRCGVETRMQEYLNAWDHIPAKQKTDWELGKLGRSVERHFRLRDRLQEWTVMDLDTGATRAVLYYTPVTSELRSNAARLGNYLHSPNLMGNRNLWWAELRTLLNTITTQLEAATTGTLLGPAMRVKGRSQVTMLSEVLEGIDMTTIGQRGEQMIVKVDYLDALPQVLPDHAIVWPTSDEAAL